MYQVQDQSLRPLTTAHLAQTMTLLALPNLELTERVLQELTENPALELLDQRVCPNCQRPLPGRGRCPICSQGPLDDEAIVFLSPRDSYRPRRKPRLEDEPADNEPAAPEDLPTYVMQQLAANLLPEDRRLAAYILYALDDDGFLQEPPALISRLTDSPYKQVVRVIDLIAHSDPPGLGMPDGRHALLAQLDLFDEDRPVVDLARRIIEETFAELARRDMSGIAKHHDVSPRQVREAARFIQEKLNPYPARAYWGSGREQPTADPNVYHRPDIQVTKNSPNGDSQLVVEIFSSVPGWLRVNPLFRKAIRRSKDDSSEEWEQHLDRASLFVKCIQQRNNTMRRLMKVLVAEQRDFILHGPRDLKPMTRAEIAEIMDVHESTVSRAVAQKSIALPDGRIIPLARFFDRSLPIRDRIKEIIENETKPLTDRAIADILHDEGIDIARRTVAKYRNQEKILSARMRHKKKKQKARPQV
jgi:RNA polymerase sigma-54 factor